MSVRTYRVGVRGFDFDAIYVRATSRGRAKYYAAMSFNDAGLGTVGDAFKFTTGVRLAPEEADRRLCSPRAGPEGVCVSDECAMAERFREHDKDGGR